MKGNTLRQVLIIILFAGLLWILPNIVNAAYISVTPSTKNAKPGQTVQITISSDCTGKVSLSASNGSVSTGSIWVEGAASATVTVGSSGTTTISVKATDMSDSAGNAVSPSGSTSIAISSNSSTGNNGGKTDTNTGSTTKSNVANLSNLGIRPNDFSGFSANKTSYSTEVPNDVETIEIYANKGQSGQKISGTGKKTLKEGANTFNIVVTAEDGKTQKTYTLNVIRKAKDDNSTGNETTEETTNETTPEDEIEDPTANAFGLTKLSIAGVELQPQFQTDVYEYRIELKEDLDKLDIEAMSTEENANIEIIGNENLQNGENIITILVNSDDESVAYQIIVNKSVETQEEETNTNKIKNIIIISTVVGLLLIVIIIIVVSKIKSKKNEAFIPYGGVFEDDDVDGNDSFDNYDNNDNDAAIEENNNFEEYEEEKPKKKRSKGKRFK